MWVLYYEGKPAYWLHGGRTYTIGRKDNDILIQDDNSISRTHLTLVVGRLAMRTIEDRSRSEMRAESTSTTASGPHPAGVTLGSRRSAAPGGGGGGHTLDVPFTELTITDSSKFGSGTRLPHKEALPVPLVKGESWKATIDHGNKFELSAGTHGLLFDVRYHPTPVALANVDAAVATDLEHHMAAAGYYVVEKVKDAALVITSTLNPSPVIMAALCAAKPIVTPKFVQTIIQRLSPKVALPEPDSLLHLPEDVDPFWAKLLEVPSPSDVDRDLFLPQKKRTSLFSTVQFVTVQRGLYNEVQLYLPLSRAHLCVDDLDPKDLHSFIVKHKSHPILFTEIDEMSQQPQQVEEGGREVRPLTTKQLVAALAALKKAGLQIVDYFAVLKAIFKAERLPLNTGVGQLAADGIKSEISLVGDNFIGGQLSANAASDGELSAKRVKHERIIDVDGTPVGRDTTRTIFGVDFTDSPSEKELAKKEGRPSYHAITSDGLGAWRRSGSVIGGFESAVNLTENGGHHQKGGSGFQTVIPAGEGVDGGDMEQQQNEDGMAYVDPETQLVHEDLVMKGGLRLPRYPCFEHVHNASGAPRETTDGKQNFKAFKKQAVAVSDTPLVELEIVKPSNNITSRIARVDADDIIPDATTGAVAAMVTGADAFNVFDIQAHHREVKTKARGKRASGKKGAAAARSNAAQQIIENIGNAVVPPAAEAVAVVDDVVVLDEMPQATPKPTPSRGGGGGGGMNIFDVDALY